MDLIITISGLHGTGKSTYTNVLACEFGLRHISAGELFRQIAAEKKCSLTELSQEAEKNDEIDYLIDERTKREIEKGKLVIDGLLAGWIAREYTSLKIYLTTPFTIRIGRIALRDGIDYSEAERVTVLRENIERQRFKRMYGFDISNLSIYDLVLNTSLMSVESNIEVLKSFIREYLRTQ